MRVAPPSPTVFITSVRQGPGRNSMRVVVAGSMLSIALLALAGPAGARDSGNDRSRGGAEQPGARSHDRTPGTGTVDRGRPDVSRAGTTVASPNPQYTP